MSGDNVGLPSTRCDSQTSGSVESLTDTVTDTPPQTAPDAAPLSTPELPPAPAEVSATQTTTADESSVPAADGSPPVQNNVSEAAVGAREPGLSPAQTAARLAELFPALFGNTPLPIKLRIQTDIQQRAPGVFTKKVMSIVLSRHTTTTPYLKALVAHSQRFDLDGQPAGEIAPEHKQAAADELARRRAIVDARRAAERAARQPRRPAGEPRDESSQARPASRHEARGEVRGDARGKARRDNGRPPRDSSPSQASRAARPVQGHNPQPRPRPPAAREPATHNHTAPVREASAIDPEQRERAALLRAWEGSALTKANFCVLKRLKEAEFDALISLAQQERDGARRIN
jgi:sRNA-binding protein